MFSLSSVSTLRRLVSLRSAPLRDVWVRSGRTLMAWMSSASATLRHIWIGCVAERDVSWR
jgi:hypothetical protein